MKKHVICVALLALSAGTAATGQQNPPAYGNVSGCDVHFNRNNYEAGDMVLLKEGQLIFYETACKNLVVGNKAGRIATLTATCVGYEEVYDFTWDLQSDGQEGFFFSSPDKSFSTLLNVCQ